MELQEYIKNKREEFKTATGSQDLNNESAQWAQAFELNRLTETIEKLLDHTDGLETIVDPVAESGDQTHAE